MIQYPPNQSLHFYCCFSLELLSCVLLQKSIPGPRKHSALATSCFLYIRGRIIRINRAFIGLDAKWAQAPPCKMSHQPFQIVFEKHHSNTCTRCFAICRAWFLHVAQIERNDCCDAKYLKVVYVTVCSGLHVPITQCIFSWKMRPPPILSVPYTNTYVDDLLRFNAAGLWISLWGTGWIRLRSASCQCSSPLHDQRGTVANQRVPRSPFKRWCWHLGNFKSDIWISCPDLGPQIEDAQTKISLNCITKGASPLYPSSSLSLSFVNH